MKDRLIKILSEACGENGCPSAPSGQMRDTVEKQADALIAAGVILPKFKIGQEVFVVRDCCGGENIVLVYNGDYYCPFGNTCEFENCDNTQKQIFKIEVAEYHIDESGLSYLFDYLNDVLESEIYAAEAEALAALEKKQ
jgi:hypothetical protein